MRIVETCTEEDITHLMEIAGTHANGLADRAQRETALRRELAERGDNRRIFVAYEGDEPVAFVQLVLNHADNDPDLANGTDVAHAHNLQVRRDLQGRGIGTAMMRYVEQTAVDMGKRKLTLGVDLVNTRALRLYEKLGYVHMKGLPDPTPAQEGIYLYKTLDPEAKT